jgi:O-methyltransferase
VARRDLGTYSISETLKNLLAARGVIVYRHGSAARDARLRFINRVKAERELLLTHVEAEQLINAVRATENIAGEVAEVGTYRGASARLLRHYGAPGKILHVFDTFAGLPPPGEHDAEFQKGQFASELDDVRAYLGETGVEYHVGRFPESADDRVRALRFSFVHLDVDLYQGTLDCLDFFYPRMNPGAILVSHDFGADRAPGVVKAFAEYFEPRQVPYVQLSGYQGMVVKLAAP